MYGLGTLPDTRISESREPSGYDVGIIPLLIRVGKRHERRQRVETQRLRQVL
jgi:hypothetical protein